jgi:hypothetical protein
MSMKLACGILICRVAAEQQARAGFNFSWQIASADCREY